MNSVTYIPSNEVVTVTEMNHIVEIQHMDKMNNCMNIRKLDKYHYVDLETGEVKEFNISDNRADNRNSLRQTFKKLRYLVNNNLTGKSNELHIVLTYSENMTDCVKLYKDFDKFMKRLKYFYKDNSTIDYISVVEPQDRGAWHCHVLLRFNDLDKVYVPNDVLAGLWRQGFVIIRSLKEIDNIAAYLSAYLTDIEIPCEKIDLIPAAMRENKREVRTAGDKMFLKGARLHMYPPGVNLYRKSKGMRYPERQRIRFKNIGGIVGDVSPHYQRSYTVNKDDFKNTITFLQYNLKRTISES